MADKYLYLDAQNVKATVADLLAAYPELAEDEALRLDMIEGETDLHTIVSRALDVRQEAETMVEAIKARAENLAARKARYERQSEAMRKLIKSVMEAAHADKLVLPEASLSIGKAREAVNVLDVMALPQGYFKTERKADKTAIKAALAAGEAIPGAELVLGDTSLTIRAK